MYFGPLSFMENLEDSLYPDILYNSPPTPLFKRCYCRIFRTTSNFGNTGSSDDATNIRLVYLMTSLYLIHTYFSYCSQVIPRCTWLYHNGNGCSRLLKVSKNRDFCCRAKFWNHTFGTPWCSPMIYLSNESSYCSEQFIFYALFS